jgi:hypothetical protein
MIEKKEENVEIRKEEENDDNEPSCERVLVSFCTDEIEGQVEVDVLFSNYEESNNSGDRRHRAIYPLLKQHLLKHHSEKIRGHNFKIVEAEGVEDGIPLERRLPNVLDLTKSESFELPACDQPVERFIIRETARKEAWRRKAETTISKKRKFIAQMKNMGIREPAIMEACVKLFDARIIDLV